MISGARGSMLALTGLMAAACSPLPLSNAPVQHPALAATEATASAAPQPASTPTPSPSRLLTGAIGNTVPNEYVDYRANAVVQLFDASSWKLVEAALADGNGNFRLDPGAGFAAAPGSTYILTSEVASDSLQYNSTVGYRTLVQWTGSGWTTIGTSSAGILIDSWTTALSTIGLYEPTVGPSGVMGKLINDIPQDVNASYSASYVGQVENWVSVLVNDGLDPSVRMTSLDQVQRFSGTWNGAPIQDGNANTALYGGAINGAMAIDPSGNLYVDSANYYKLRQVSSTGYCSTIAGNGSAGTTDGPAPSASFGNSVNGMAFYNGNLYFSDTNNHTIRELSPASAAGNVSTLAGTPGVPGYVDSSQGTPLFHSPQAMTVDAQGNLYVADQTPSGNTVIREITQGGVVSTFAGNPGHGGYQDGAANVAEFNDITDLAMDARGDLFVLDRGNYCIREVSNGQVSTVAGSPTVRGTQDGPAASALFYYPQHLCVDPHGDLWVSDYMHGQPQIRELAGGVVRTIISARPFWQVCCDVGLPGWTNGDDAPAPLSYLTDSGAYAALASDAQGDIYYTNSYFVGKIVPQ